ncbi:MAG: L-histidine N(alpha)-methyltransferase [Pseudomonadota bacterium]
MIAIDSQRSDDPSIRVLRHLDWETFRSQMRHDVKIGLVTQPRFLHSKYFYDEVGSKLFDDITSLPEYYLTRAETGIIATHATEIIRQCEPSELLELGSGTATKTRLLLDALAERPGPRRFVAFDISRETLEESVKILQADYSTLTIAGLVGDFTQDLSALPRADIPRTIAFLGSTIGNLNHTQRVEFFDDVSAILAPNDSFLLGIDLVKDPAVLEAAYNDSAGITAKFNQNILHVLNRELDADFPVDHFQHVAKWNSERSHIESWLIPDKDVVVTIRALDEQYRFEKGEGIHTEISAKFTEALLAHELAPAHLAIANWFTDQDERYALALVKPA